MIITKPVKNNSKNKLIFIEKELVFFDKNNHFLSSNGALNFLASMATLYLVNSYSENIKKVQKKFDEILKSDLTILGAIKKYMYSFIELKVNEKDPSILHFLKNIKNSPYYLDLKTEPLIYDVTIEQLIEDISIIRNLELGNYLFKEISITLLNLSNGTSYSDRDILKTIPENEFQDTIISLIDEQIKEDENHALEIKKLLYNCNLYLRDIKIRSSMFSFIFCMNIKTNANLFELNLKYIKKVQNKIVTNIYKTNIQDKRRNRGNNQGSKL